MSAGAVDAVGATYAEISTAPTVTTTLAGTYAGYIRTIGGGAPITASVDATGQMSANASTGCKVTATLSSRELGNL